MYCSAMISCIVGVCRWKHQQRKKLTHKQLPTLELRVPAQQNGIYCTCSLKLFRMLQEFSLYSCKKKDLQVEMKHVAAKVDK